MRPQSATTACNESAGAEGAASIVAGDKDVAITILGEQRYIIDPAAEARVVRKIDWFLVSAMSIGYGLTFYDKVYLTIPDLSPNANFSTRSEDLQHSSE